MKIGTLRERSPGTWELTVSAGREPATGRYRRVTRTLHTTSTRQAKLALGELETSVSHPGDYSVAFGVGALAS